MRQVMEQIPGWFNAWLTRRSVGLTKFYADLALCDLILQTQKAVCRQRIPTELID